MKTVIGVESFEQMKARMLERAAKMDRGERLRPERRISFESAEDMLACMTPQRIRLLQKAREEALSVTDLARALGRDRKSVHRDVKALREFNLLAVKKQVNPGHGVVQMVRARSKRMELRASL